MLEEETSEEIDKAELDAGMVDICRAVLQLAKDRKVVAWLSEHRPTLLDNLVQVGVRTATVLRLEERGRKCH